MIIDQLNQWWSTFIAFSAQFVTPDWAKLIPLIPVILLLLVVGPIVTLLALAWLRYGAIRPRRHVAFADARRAAELDADGQPVYPAGEPYSPSGAGGLRARRHAVRIRRGAPRRLPQVQPRPPRRPRHLRQLRALVHPQAHHPLARVGRAAARRGRRRLSHRTGRNRASAPIPPPRPSRHRATAPASRVIDMAQASSLLFILGTIATALGFAAHVGHAVLLANGRRVTAFAPSAARQPAFAAAGVTGSFVASRAAAASGGASLATSPRRCTRAATLATSIGFALLLASLVLRGIAVGRGPYGNLYEFSVAFATSILGGYLFLARRYPIRQIGFIPVGVALAIAAVRLVAAVGHRAARPGPPERAAADHPRGAGGASPTGSSPRRSRPASATWSRAPATGSRGCRRTGRSTRSPTAR